MAGLLALTCGLAMAATKWATEQLLEEQSITHLSRELRSASAWARHALAAPSPLRPPAKKAARTACDVSGRSQLGLGAAAQVRVWIVGFRALWRWRCGGVGACFCESAPRRKHSLSGPRAGVHNTVWRTVCRAGDPPASVAAPAATLPPPTPASLADLPKPWLLKLAGADSFNRDSITLWDLSRTCSLFRDLVLRERKATAWFKAPVEDCPRQLGTLCTLARHSQHIKLAFRGPPEPLSWTETEPHVAHLLLCTMAQLGGQPLTAVKEIEFWVSSDQLALHPQCPRLARRARSIDRCPTSAAACLARPRNAPSECAVPPHLHVHALQDQEQGSVVPMWLPVTCPNITSVYSCGCDVVARPILPPPPPPCSAASDRSPPPAPAACHHLQSLSFFSADHLTPRQLAWDLRQQLAALPSLSELTLWSTEGLLEEPHSASVTRLRLDGYGQEDEQEEEQATVSMLRRLPVQFPGLVELDAPQAFSLGDAGLEVLLGMRGLRRVAVRQLDLQRSHAHRPCAWEQLSLATLVVDQLARLPLEGVQRLQGRAGDVRPSRDAQAVARFAAAVKRSVTLCCEPLDVHGEDAAALLATLRPLLEALPSAEERRSVGVSGLHVGAPDVLRELCQQLTPGVEALRLRGCMWRPEAFPALLPSLPATVARVDVHTDLMTPESREGAVLAVCRAAVRPVEVGVALPAKARARVLSRLAKERNTRVTLVECR